MNQSDPANPRPLSPLGGHVHRPVPPSGGFTGSYLGSRPKVRACPACGFHNPERNIFCANCGASITDVEPTTENSADTGRRQMIEKLDRARREELSRRARPARVATVGPFLVLGAVLFIFAVWMTDDGWPRYVIWCGAVGLLGFSIWRMRYDLDSLRRSGAALGLAAAAVLLLVGARSFSPSASTMPPTQSAAAASTPASVATPAPGEPRLAGSMPMLGVDPGHTFRQPGPAPAASPVIAWRFDTGGEIYSAPALANGVLYITSKSGNIIALDATTGKQRWQHQLGDYVVRSSPAVANGIVYVGGGFNLYAFDAATGAVRWEFPMHYAGQSSPTVAGGQVFIGSQEGYLYAVDAATGKLNWQLDTDGLVFASPSISNGNLIVGTDDGTLICVGMSDGHVVWRQTLDGPVYASTAVDGDAAYVTASNGFTYRVSIADGSIVWRAPIGGDVSPAVGTNVVAVAAKDGGIYGLDPKTGTTKWLFPAGATYLAAPVSASAFIIVGGDRNLYAIDAKTGARDWYFLASDTVETPSTVIGGYVFFGSRDGFLYAVKDVQPSG